MQFTIDGFVILVVDNLTHPLNSFSQYPLTRPQLFSHNGYYYRPILLCQLRIPCRQVS